MSSALEIKDIGNDALIETAEIKEVAIDPDDGVLADTEKTIGLRYNFYNHYNDIKLFDSYISVSVDCDGIYSVVNKWDNVVPNEQTTKTAAVKTVSEAMEKINEFASISKHSQGNLQAANFVYILSDNGTYELNYQIDMSDGASYAVSCVDGNTKTLAK